MKDMMNKRLRLSFLPLVALAAAALVACGAANGACQVVDTVHNACTVLRYLGPDGGEEVVNVSSEEVASFARETKARHSAVRDAGAP